MTDSERFAYDCMKLAAMMRGFASGLKKGPENATLIAMLRDSADLLLVTWNEYALANGIQPYPKEEDE
jgi:hypothetical protein